MRSRGIFVDANDVNKSKLVFIYSIRLVYFIRFGLLLLFILLYYDDLTIILRYDEIQVMMC